MMRKSTSAASTTTTAAAASPTPLKPPLVIGCGALARELVELTRNAGLPAMDLTCLPASLHNRPERIPAAVAARIRRARAQGYEQIFVAYADCGTGGLLDRMLETEPAAAGIARLEGAHCYEVYAGRAAFASLHDAEPGTFYLTDYLVRNFDRLVVRGLGLDRHPELLSVYFGNYRRLVYLAQTDDAELTARAEAAAARLGNLAFERRLAGLGELVPALATFADGNRVSQTRTRPETRSDTPSPGATSKIGVSRTRWKIETAASGVVDDAFVSGASRRSAAPPSAQRSERAGLVSHRHRGARDASPAGAIPPGSVA